MPFLFALFGFIAFCLPVDSASVQITGSVQPVMILRLNGLGSEGPIVQDFITLSPSSPNKFSSLNPASNVPWRITAKCIPQVGNPEFINLFVGTGSGGYQSLCQGTPLHLFLNKSQPIVAHGLPTVNRRGVVVPLGYQFNPTFGEEWGNEVTCIMQYEIEAEKI